MAQPRTLYEDGRPYTVPESLEELTGPTAGVVELPWPGLQEHGATLLRHVEEPGGERSVLTDPDGDEFCVA